MHIWLSGNLLSAIDILEMQTSTQERTTLFHQPHLSLSVTKLAEWCLQVTTTHMWLPHYRSAGYTCIANSTVQHICTANSITSWHQEQMNSLSPAADITSTPCRQGSCRCADHIYCPYLVLMCPCLPECLCSGSLTSRLAWFRLLRLLLQVWVVMPQCQQLPWSFWQLEQTFLAG